MRLLLILAIIPGLIIGLLVYLSDKKEKEPIFELIKAFLMGIVAIIVTLAISYFLHITDIDVTDITIAEAFLYSFVLIALVEELSKWFAGYVFLRKNKNFNYMYDGIVYMTFIALGFATVENILYAFSSNLSTVLIRAVTTVPAHAFFGIASGYYFALAIREEKKNNMIKKTEYLFLSIFVPIVLHGFFDFCLLTGNYIFFMIFVVFVVALYIISISNAKRMERIDHLLDSKDIHCRNCGQILVDNKCPSCSKEEN